MYVHTVEITKPLGSHVVLREPVANKIKYPSNNSSDQNDQFKSM